MLTACLRRLRHCPAAIVYTVRRVPPDESARLAAASVLCRLEGTVLGQMTPRRPPLLRDCQEKSPSDSAEVNPVWQSRGPERREAGPSLMEEGACERPAALRHIGKESAKDPRAAFPDMVRMRRLVRVKPRYGAAPS